MDKCTLSTHISASSREECTMTVSPGASSVLLGHRRIAVVLNEQGGEEGGVERWVTGVLVHEASKLAISV